MKILFVTPELYPFAKTGGLADYSSSLALKLYEMGHDVRVIMPKYRSVRSITTEMSASLVQHSIELLNIAFEFTIVQASLEDKVPVYLVENDGFFDREELYHTRYGDYPDNAVRYIFFNRAVLDGVKRLDFRPDIIHCNDWQTSLIPVLLRSKYKSDPYFKQTAAFLTIHNLAYQGSYWHYDMKLTGLGWEYFTPDTLEFYGRLNLLKGGILFSDMITTVSPNYAREICSKKHGHGLEGILKQRKKNLCGILNGIDLQTWSPETDPHLPAHYSHTSMAGKTENKRLFLQEFGLRSKPGLPLVCMISRLESLKGIDILLAMCQEMMHLSLQFVVLGKGRFDYQEALTALQQQYPDKMRYFQAFDEKLAHRIEAAADIILLPSLYEPCGLNAMYSMRYGTVPVVRKTGGLADTVIDFQTNPARATGFTFNSYSGKALLQCLKNALGLFAKQKSWRQLMLRGMTADFSWDKSAKQYTELYSHIIKRKTE